jgi:hypothetical protein
VNVFAQQATDNTGRTVTFIIIGLLLVALMLGLLTFWYWRHTDPRSRMRLPMPDPVNDQDQAVELLPSTPTDVGVDLRSSAELLAEDDADEWLRLTGPQARRRDPLT